MLQHGSYTLLLDACYDREQFPTLAEAIDWAWASSKEEIEAVEFVLKRFFELENGVYVQRRVQEELAEFKLKADTNKRIATERETKRKEISTNRAPVVNDASPVVNEPPPNHEPRTMNHEPVLAPAPSARSTAKGSRLEAGWRPSEELQEWASTERPDLEIQTSIDSFVDFWKAKTGKDATKLDWDATFRNWIRSQRQQFKVVKQSNGVSMLAGVI